MQRRQPFKFCALVRDIARSEDKFCKTVRRVSRTNVEVVYLRLPLRCDVALADYPWPNGLIIRDDALLNDVYRAL